MSSKARNAFHDHLDTCKQCANHPFELCPDGAKLLELTGNLVDALEKKLGGPVELVETSWGRRKG